MAEKELERTNRKTRPGRCDICEEDYKIIMRVDMPGVKKENLDIKINDDQLIISGKKEPAAQGGEYVIREIDDMDYYQAYTIDNTIDRDKIDANLEKGVLTLTLGLKEAEKPRKITIDVK